MPSDVRHFLIWTVLLGLLPPAVVLLMARRFGTERPLARLNVRAGPALLCVVWLHGVLFDPPNNWAVLHDGHMKSYAPDGTLLSSSPGMGFFEFWFKPFRAMDWDAERVRAALWLGLPAIALLVVVVLAGRRKAPHARGEVTGAVGYACWVLAGLLLRHIPDHVLDVPDLYFGDRAKSGETHGHGVLLLLALPPLSTALALTWRRPAKTPGVVEPR